MADDHLAGTRPDQPGDLVPDAGRRVDPVSGVPAADQAGAPLFGDDLVEPLRGLPWQGPQGIAVEIDDAVGEGELLTHGSQRILPIEREAGLAVHGGIIPRGALLELARAPGSSVDREHGIGSRDRTGGEPLMRPARYRLRNRLPPR